jgi:hypothetical protein
MAAAAILEDIGTLLAELEGLGAKETASQYDAAHFGDFYVDVRGRKGTFRIVRDRGQYILDGDLERIKTMGYWRAFDSRAEFFVAVLTYARAVV